MTNEEVRKLLEAKFQGLEGAILDWQVGKITKQCQSSEDAERVVEGLSLQKLVEGYADYRATQASQSAVANYKRELEGAEGAKEQEETESAKPAEKIDEDDTPAWARALIEQNKALGKRIGELEGARVRETRGATFGKLLESLPETFRKAYERIPVETYSDSDFEKLCEEIRTEVGTIETELKARGGRVGYPPINSGGERSKELPSEEESEAFLQKMNLTVKD